MIENNRNLPTHPPPTPTHTPTDHMMSYIDFYYLPTSFSPTTYIYAELLRHSFPICLDSLLNRFIQPTMICKMLQQGNALCGR